MPLHSLTITSIHSHAVNEMLILQVIDHSIVQTRCASYTEENIEGPLAYST